MTDTGAEKTRDTSTLLPSILTVMRVKNEAPYLAHALKSLEGLGPVILLDDGSTDGTPDIAQSFDFVEYNRQDLDTMDEGRDRTSLYQMGLYKSPEWMFTLDGDEVLDGPSAEMMLRAVRDCPDDVNVFEMFIAVMSTDITAPRQKWFGPVSPTGLWSMDRLFRVRDAAPEYEFTSNFGNNLHCGCVPEMRERKKLLLDAFIQGYGYESPQTVARKREFYKEHDPVNFPRVEQMWKQRAELKPVAWREGPSAREWGRIGVHRF